MKPLARIQKPLAKPLAKIQKPSSEPLAKPLAKTEKPLSEPSTEPSSEPLAKTKFWQKLSDNGFEDAGAIHKDVHHLNDIQNNIA